MSALEAAKNSLATVKSKTATGKVQGSKRVSKTQTQESTPPATTDEILALLKDSAAGAVLDTSNPFGFLTDLDTIKTALNEATNAAYDKNLKESTLGLQKAEDTAYNNSKNTVNDLRRTLASGVVSGANRGAANAAALQAILGLGQQNTNLVTEGLQKIQGVADARAQALAQNAVDAISQSNSAKSQQAAAANEKYTADQTRGAEALAAVSALKGTYDTNATNMQMNTDTNTANKEIANINADATKYTADTNLKGVKHTANKNLEGTKVTANKNLEGTKVTANANKNIAKTTSKSEVTYYNK